MAGVARWSLRWDRLRDRPDFWLAATAAGLAAVALLSCVLGAVRTPLLDLPGILADEGHPLHAMFWSVRLPRAAAAVLVGASLAVSGLCMQAVVRNPLADPGLLGVTAAAGLGAMIAILFLPPLPWMLVLAALAGGLLGLGLVLGMLRWASATVGPLRVILCGIALQAVFFALIGLLMFFFADRAPAFIAFTVGSLTGATWTDVGLAALPLAAGLGLAWLAIPALDLLHLDDGSAAGLGLSVESARLAVACIAALLAAGAVTVGGLIGFVGLIVPNIARVAIGPSHRILLPLSALGGGLLCASADLVARTAASPIELPVGSLLAILGGPTLLWLLWSRIP